MLEKFSVAASLEEDYNKILYADNIRFTVMLQQIKIFTVVLPWSSSGCSLCKRLGCNHSNYLYRFLFLPAIRASRHLWEAALVSLFAYRLQHAISPETEQTESSPVQNLSHVLAWLSEPFVSLITSQMFFDYQLRRSDYLLVKMILSFRISVALGTMQPSEPSFFRLIT